MRKKKEILKTRGIIANALPEGVLVTDKRGTLIYVNPALEKMFGIPSSVSLGTHFRNYLTPASAPDAEAAFLHCAQGRIVQNVELGAVHQDGHVFPIEIAVSPVVQDGEFLGVESIVHDITEHKRMEQALRQSEQRYRKLFEASLAGAYLTKLDGTILDFNDAMMRMLGYESREEVFRHRSTDFYADPVFRKLLIYLLQRDGIVPAKEAVLQRKDGSLLYALGHAVLLTNEQTGEPYIQGVAVDITERKLIEERLAKNLKDLELLSVSAMRYLEVMPSEELIQYTAEQLQSIAGHALIAINEYDPDTDRVIVRAVAGPEDKRQKIAELLGRDPVGLAFPLPEGTLTRMVRGQLELVAGRLRDLPSSPMPVPLAAQIERECQIGEIYAMPLCLGEDLIGTVTVAADQAEGLKNRTLIEAVVNQAALALKRTRTEEILRRNEQALRELTRTLESKVGERTAELQRRAQQLQKIAIELSETEDRERRRLAEVLHDDLQQVLAGAKFQVGLMRSRVLGDASLQSIAAQVDHLLKDAIQKSRSLSHELSPAVMHHADFVETLRWLGKEMQTKHGLAVHVRADGEVRSESEAVKAFLYRAAQELLFNVVKHAQVQEATVRIRPCNGSVCLLVSDRGRGFDPQKLGETAGFGLLSIRERAELLHGCMRIRSTKGKGSTFFLMVPADTGPEDRGQQKEEAVGVGPRAYPTSGGQGGPPLRVLLADDHEIVRQGLSSLLSEEHRVEVVGEAATGQEAVDLAAQLEPDVVVMDVSMPALSGDEATRRIKSHRLETRVVAFSMHEEPEAAERMHAAGAESYVLKTAPAEELLAAIRGKGASP